MKINKDWFKYASFILLFAVLFLPATTSSWIWVIFIAGIFLLIWLFKAYGKLDFFKYCTIMFLGLALVSDIASREQRWFIWIGTLSFLIWLVKWLLAKSD